MEQKKQTVDIRVLRILSQMWRLHGLQAKMTLELSAGNLKAVREVSGEITQSLEDIGNRLNLAIDDIEGVLDAHESPDNGGN